MILMMACSCSLLPTKQIEITAKPMDRTIVQPELKDVVVYYRKVTTKQDKEDE